MLDTPDLGRIASLIGDTSRSRMLGALMDGRALTATELALEAGVAPSTASSHLDQLVGAGLVSLARQGRHRYFRIAGPEVGAALEGLMAIAPGGRPVRTGPRDDGMRWARVCYDHLAGEAAVRLLEALVGRGWIQRTAEAMEPTPAGEAWFGLLGIEVAALRRRRRPLCHPCLDWSERRYHLAGALGATLLERLFALRLARRETGSRTIRFTAAGTAFLDSLEPPRGAAT